MNVAALRRVTLLLSGLGFLCVEADILVEPKFNPKKFAGKWYPILSVTNVGKPLDNVLGPIFIKVKAKDRLTWSIDFPYGETMCQKETHTLTQLEQPGKYNTKWNFVFRIVETDYSGYFILHKDAMFYKFMALYARKKKASDEAEKTFEGYSSSLGFPMDKVYRTRLIECPEPKKYKD